MPSCHRCRDCRRPCRRRRETIRQRPHKAAEAAAATLTALLPRLAASDTMPMLDRSAMFAGDLSRLLANYDLSQLRRDLQRHAGESGGKVQPCCSVR